jgi:MarR family transcriptional regulator, lower aerobic nicotinate degradation pathway regulator
MPAPRRKQTGAAAQGPNGPGAAATERTAAAAERPNGPGAAASERTAAAAEALAAVAPLATRWIERLLARHEPSLTVPQYLALRAITREGVTGSELARRTGVSGPAVSQLLGGLASAGLIERSADAADRRRQALTLSAAGERAFASAEALLRDRLSELLADLPRPEIDALGRLLPSVEAALSGAPPPRRPPPPPPPRRP